MKSFVDANVIILAANNKGEDGRAALEYLAREDREWLTSPFVELEVKPKPVRLGEREEVEFIDAFLGKCRSISNLEKIVRLAYQEMTVNNVKVVDALHLAAAHVGGADEFVTFESFNQPMHKTRLVKIRRLPE